MKEKIASISILANFFLAAGKVAVGLLSHSTAILAAGVDSCVDIFSSIVSYAGIKIAQKPADQKHPYGHYKFEVLGGVVITTIILITGFGILYEAYRNFLKPQSVKITYLAFTVMIFSVAINEIMARLKTYYGKKENSVSLLSDGVHSRIDVYTSLAILAGLFFTKYWIYTDAFLALLMGFYIIKEAFSVGKDAISSLLDVSAGQEIEEKIKSIAQEQNIEVNSLKTQKKGSAITANLEIKLPSNLNVDQAAKISNSLREKLINAVENLTYVAIQIASHQLETGFYKPSFGHSFGWQRKGRFKNNIKEAGGKGPSGYCVCEKCNYKIEHQRRIPCSTLKCPKCNINLKRS